MRIQVFLALFISRLIRLVLRVTGRGGTALPGRVALRLCPGLLKYLAKDVKTVLVTGTNGKTTSCRIVEQLLREAGYTCFANRGGANLVQGITTEFAMNATLTGQPKYQWAVIECDEGVVREICRRIEPRVVLVTNVFSDQLDRFGDVTNTMTAIRAGLQNARQAVFCLNADCSLSAAMPRGLENNVIYYGVETEIYHNRVREVSDAPCCPYCGAKYEYDWHTFGHLGGFRCPECGWKRPETDVAVTGVIEQSADETLVTLRLGEQSYRAAIAVPGGYNIYNAAGAAAVGVALELDEHAILRALERFHCGFGRMEKLELEDHTARMILVKNPAGCNQALNFLSNLDGRALFVICLNDMAGDGTDISWIWDADFEALLALEDRLTGVLCTGLRGAEMALRLKYGGLPEEKLRVLDNYDEVIETMLGQSEPIIIMPTYSAMMEFRDKLRARFGMKDFWE